MSDQIRTGVIGVGYLGRFHAQKYKALPACKLMGVVDGNLERAKEVGAELEVPGYDQIDTLLDQVDAVSIAVTTSAHYEVAMKCLKAGKHVLLEKPMAPTVIEAKEIVEAAKAHGVLLQVGFLERFNPAFQACHQRIVKPQFIEAIRIASFLERGADVDVVLDLMSHDLDLVLDLVKSPLKDLHAVGKSLLTESTDLASVRLMFEDGTVVAMTVSRISNKVERKLRVFCKDSYFSMDFQKPSARIYTGTPDEGAKPPVKFSEELLTFEKGDALLAEITAFLESIRTGSPAVVSGDDGLRAMIVAERVIADIAQNRFK